MYLALNPIAHLDELDRCVRRRQPQPQLQPQTLPHLAQAQALQAECATVPYCDWRIMYLTWL